jgi:hypothetical protein
LITLILFGETCKLWSSSLCSLLQPPVTSYLLSHVAYTKCLPDRIYKINAWKILRKCYIVSSFAIPCSTEFPCGPKNFTAKIASNPLPRFSHPWYVYLSIYIISI